MRQGRIGIGSTTMCLAVLLLLAGSAYARDEIVGLAHVQEDGSLRIKNKVIRLHGIYMPETDYQCRDWIRPVRCAERGVLALDFKVRGFIRCYPQHRNNDDSISAICYVGRNTFDDGEDLGAYLIERGWALARPGAPFEYHAMERIARQRGFGVWGFPVDSIVDPNAR